MKNHWETTLVYGLLLSLFLGLGACQTDPERKLTRIEEMLEEHRDYDTFLKKHAKKHKMDWLLAKAILIKESHFEAEAISSTGAVGLMQLMPRKSCYTTANYDNFMKSRRQKNRTYKGKRDKRWASAYRKDLKKLLASHIEQPDSLHSKDKRFDPNWNIEQGIIHYKKDYDYFRKRKHSKYKSRILALAAYNAGRGNVVRDKKQSKHDATPVNRQTEFYVIYVERMYKELKKTGGRINKYNQWILEL